jgi:hypothetical protein
MPEDDLMEAESAAGTQPTGVNGEEGAEDEHMDADVRICFCVTAS